MIIMITIYNNSSDDNDEDDDNDEHPISSCLTCPIKKNRFMH